MTVNPRNFRSVARPEAVFDESARPLDFGDQFSFARSFAGPLQVFIGPDTSTDPAVAPALEGPQPGDPVEAFLPTNPDDEIEGGTLELNGTIHHVYADVGGFSYVFVAGGEDDGVSVFRLNQNGTLTPVHDVNDDVTMALNGARGLSTAMVDGNTYLFVSGQADNGVSVFRVNTNGSLVHVQQVLDDGTMFLSSVNSTATARVGAFTYLFTAGQNDDGISTFRVAGDGRLTNVANFADTGAVELDGVSDVHTVTIGGTTFLIAAGNTDDGISVFSVAANGTLTHVTSITDAGAFELDGAFEVTTATVNGTVYVYVAGNVDNGISVWSMNGAGTLTHVQNIVDDATNRLSGVGSLSVLSFGGHQYLSASGAESGISLFRIGAGGTGDQLGVAGTLNFIGNILDDANVNIGGFTTVSSAQVGGTTHLIGGGFTDDGVSVFGSSTTGQLMWFGQGGTINGRLAYVNNDGFNHISFVDTTPTADLITQFPQEIGVDGAAGFYFALVNGGNDGSGGRLIRGSLTGGAATVLITFDGANNIIGDLDDEIVNAIHIDVINERIYLGIQEALGDPSLSGIREYSYNPLTGAITDLGWFINANTDATKPTPFASGFDLFDVRDFDIDFTTNTLYFTELLTGGSANTQGLYRMNMTTKAVTLMTSTVQFPAGNNNPADFTNGYIIDVEVDNVANKVYFTTQSQGPFNSGNNYNANFNKIYWLAEGASNATATELTLVGLPGGHPFYGGDMVFDQVTRLLYVESEGDGSSAGADNNSADDVIFVFSINAAGTIATLVNTINPDPAFNADNINIGGMHFNQIATLAGVTATGNIATEQGAAVDLLNGAPTIADSDHDHLRGATVQVTGGFFNSSDNSFNDDDLGVGAGMQQSGLVAGTNITVTWDQATGTLTLTGYDTHANYQNVLNNIHFQSSGDNPTNYGLNTSRTITWTVNDGTFGVPGGQQNSQVTTVSIQAINDAPVNTPGAAMNFNEDTTGNVGAEGVPPTPASNGITGISVFDVDANPGLHDITVTLSVGVGTLTIRTDVAGGITAADVISGNGTGTIVITATQNEINTTLAAMSPAFTGPPAVAAAPNGLIYTPPANYNGATNLTITTNDNGNTGNDPGLTGTGTSEQDQDVKVINVADVNDAPTVAGDGTESAADILEDTPFTNITAPTVAALFGGQFADAVDIQVSGGNPTGSVGDTFAGIAIVADGSSPATGQWEYWNGAAWTDIGAASQAAARTFTAATQIRFNPALNYNGAAPTLTVHLIETGGPAITNNGTVNLSPAGTATGGTTVYSSGTVVLSQNIIAVNDAPVNTVGAPMTVAEDSGATNVTGMSISDVDANPATDIFTVTLDVLNGTLTLSLVVPGGVTAATGNGTATVSFTGTINEINATLAAAGGLTYTPNNNYNGSDRVQITTNDGGATGQDPGTSGTATTEQDQDSKAITVTAVNDPVTGTAPASLNISEDAGATAVTGLSISDVDAALAPAGVYEVTLSATNGTLTLTTLAGLTFTAGDGTADATMTFHGTLAAINTALATASYTAAANFNGAATITLFVTDTFGGIVATGTGAATSDTDIVNVTVSEVNDPVTTNAPASLLLNEDAAGTAVTGLSISDVDATLAPAGVYDVTLSATVGTLTLSTLTGLTFTTGDGTDDATMTFHGTLADINTALATATYTPPAHYNGGATITLSATDTFGGIVATGTGAATSDSDNIAVTVTAINDTPVVAVVASVNSTEQVAGLIDATATIADVELGARNGGNGDYSGSSLTIGRNGGPAAEDLLNFAASGAFTVDGSNLKAGGLIFATFTGGNGSNLVITFTSLETAATQALVNAVVQAVQYTYTGDTPPASIVMNYSFNDGAPGNAGQGGGGSPTGTDAVTINITDTPENSPPTLDLDADDSNTVGTGYTGAFTEGGAAVLITDADVAIADADAGDMIESATIAIQSAVAGDQLVLGPQGGFVVTGSGTGTITITGTGTAAQYQAMLELITFQNTGNDPGASRTINVTVNDGTDNSNIAVATINITQINQEPTLIATGATPTFTEGGAAVDLFGGVTVSTVEAGQTITSMTLTVTNVGNPGSEVLVIDGSDVAINNGNMVVTAGNGLTVSVTMVGATATVTFSGAALSPATMAAIIDAMTYRNLSDNPTDADRVITITQLVDSGSNTPPNDNTATFNVAATVNVDPVNDAPVNTVPGTQTINEDASVTLSTANGNAISVADLDATAVSVTLSVLHGTLTLASTTGLSFGAGDGTNDTTMTFTGTAAAINAALGAGLTYNPNANFNGSDTITVFTTDNGQTGGPAQTDSDPITINITAINDAPVVIGDGTEQAADIDEDTPGPGQTIQALFSGQYSDAADNQIPNGGASSPGQFSGIAIVANGSSAATGQWQYFNGAVWVDIGPASPGAAVLLGSPFTTLIRFNPALDFYGDAPTLTVHLIDNSLPFGITNGMTVNISGPGATGGTTAYSAGTVVLNQYVIPDNFPPIVDLNGGSAGVDYATLYNEDGPGVAIGSPVVVSDADEVPLGDRIESATITLTDKVAGDALTLTGALPVGFTAVTVELAGSITITITGTGTGAQYQALIQSILYSTTNQNPTVFGTDASRTITVVVNDGEADSATATSTIVIVPNDDAAVAQPDAFTITESGTIVAGNLFANNGSGTDSDVDGPPLAISQVNGSALNVGTQIVLASGALLTVNANGTFDYNPNGAFLPTPVAGSGASNTPAQDSFTYMLANGNTVTVTITLTGLDTDDVMIGTAGGDTLISDGGQDDLFGLAGDDVYHIADASDVVHEVVGEGADIVYVGASYALAAGSSVELLSSNDIGAVTALDLAGNELANFLYGNNGTNTLNGGGGTDYLRGFGGDDYYYVDSADDTTFEVAGEGTDVVYTSVSYALAVGSSVELLSASDINATTPLSFLGNELHNLIYGNAGNNVLNGGGGADYLRGNDGDDLYYVDGSIDVVDELAGGGTDIIFTGGTYVLAAASSVEILSANDINANVAMDLGGNELVNLIYGNAAGNTINGGAGADYMRGNAGDDIYHVDNTGDYVDESGGQGTDTIYTQVSYALAAGSSVEILSAADLSSTDPIDLTGNEIANYIIGNAGNNTLNGGGGADLLVGRGGNDIYYVGSGAAQVIEDAGGGNDTVYTSVSYTLAAGQEIELLLAQDMAGSDPINLTGNELNNTIYGNNGANLLDGKGGNDSLIGLGGADTFAFTTALGAGNVDVVFGFEHGVDKIALDDAIFTAVGAPGALNANAFVVGSAAADASDRIIYNSLTGQLFYDADGNGAGAAIQFATMSPGLTLTASDFQVI